MAGLLQQLSGNPFSTPIGQKIEQATDAFLPSEDWSLNIEICDLINDVDEGPRDAVRAIKKRLQQNAGKNHTVVMYTLTVLETCVKNCGKRFHLLVTNKDFVQDLVKLIGPKNDPPPALQEKVLSLIQSWSEAFRGQSELQGVVQVYTELKSKGIEFPPSELDTMAPIHTPQRTVPVSPPQQSLQHSQALQQPQASPQRQQLISQSNPMSSLPANVPPKSQPLRQPVAVPVAVPVQLSPDQLAKLRSELDIVQGNMKVFSDMLNELKPGQEHNEDWELIRDLNNTCQTMQNRIVDLIEKVANEEVTSELLRVNDELNNLFLRYERYVKKRTLTSNLSPKKEETGEESLIDFNASVEEASQNSVTSKLAALDIQKENQVVGASGGSGADDFDMFAQSRSSFDKPKIGLATESVPVDPIEASSVLTQLKTNRNVSEAAAYQTFQREQDFDEMEKWLKDETGDRQEPASISSSEFDKFLAERATALEKAPDRPPGSGPPPKPNNDPFGL